MDSLTFKANLDGFNVKVVSIDGFQVNKLFTDSTSDGDTSITISPNDLLPVQLQNALDLGALKSVIGEGAPIVLNLTKDGATSVTETITLELVVEKDEKIECMV